MPPWDGIISAAFVLPSMCFSPCFALLELLVSGAKADLTLQDAVKNTALHLACSKVCTVPQSTAAVI